MAKKLRVHDQHIAVFGPSGSGKTVLVSSFYGAAQEPEFMARSLYTITADDTGKGTQLFQNYLGMKRSAAVPPPTRFAATAHAFTVKMKDPGDPKAATNRRFDALRLVWHDYPGEWFEEEPSSEEEARRRVEAFRTLLRSDVAVVLVDGQKLLDYAADEQRYLKSLFWGLRAGLERLKDDLLDGTGPIAQFPRVWVIALSKADLHPDLDVHGFRELVIEKAAGDVIALHDALKGLVTAPEALSMGEDFLLLSSAKFEPDAIRVSERVGVDLLLPIACVLPLERLAQWVRMADVPLKLLGQLGENAELIATLLGGARFLDSLIAKVPGVGPVLSRVARPALISAVTMSGTTIKKIHAEALARRDHLTATLAQLRLQIAEGVEKARLVTSTK